jgi:hypothetical protein
MLMEYLYTIAALAVTLAADITYCNVFTTSIHLRKDEFEYTR